MEMVLVDEKGNKMRASMLTKIFLKFGTKVKLNSTLLITNTFLADLKPYERILGHKNKISFNLTTKMFSVDDFIGEPFAFSFESFEDINANKFKEFDTVDVIGCDTSWEPISSFGKKGPNDMKMTLKVKDNHNREINVTLFGDYAKQMDAFITKHPDAYDVVIILQFGEPSVSNNYYVSKLFIDEDIPAINVFKQSVENGGALSSSRQRSISSSSVCMVNEDFLERTPFNLIAEIEIDKIKLVIILATIVYIPPVQEWHYFACGRCLKLLKLKSDESNDDNLYECLTEGCKDKSLLPVSRFRIHIRVRDTIGTISLTLWDKEAFKILNVTAESLVEETKGSFNIPTVFNTLLQRKYAFKIDIKEYNILKNSMNFNIAKLSEDSFIVNCLEKKSNTDMVEISEQNPLTSEDCQSEDTVNNNNSITPISNRDTNRQSSPPSDLKRKLGDIYNIDDDAVANSTNKSKEKQVSCDVSGDNNLLIPKKEK
ncbi:replication protein A 70 kDa DNA-binding subunit B-like [Bidens hawaiensis]|uniref:replication protein A 70 kDa DNA-binding subunit B-like n=1 Tax=Bidens hawaiensis TaxID=980011 RepID=UPI00404A314C